MTTSDGQVVGSNKIFDAGDPADRLNIVILSEGYTQAQLPQFATDAQSIVDRLFQFEPFDRMKCAINFYRVDVRSTDSGADDPLTCGGSGDTQATYFDATYCGDGNIRRLLTANGTTARAVADDQVPQWHQIIVVVNSAVRGGSGGSIAVTSTGGADWREVAIHEMGHSVFGLADEYDYWAGCGEAGRDNHPAGEPGQVNVTLDDQGAKWNSLHSAGVALPTMDNPDCSTCDRRASTVANGTVGTFEGAHYYKCGCYRPEYSCMMRETSQPFCAVCQKRIRDTLRPYMPDCVAPTFPGASGLGGIILCIILAAAYAAAAAALILLIWIPGVLCTIKQLLFRARNCIRGNDRACVEL